MLKSIQRYWKSRHNFVKRKIPIPCLIQRFHPKVLYFTNEPQYVRNKDINLRCYTYVHYFSTKVSYLLTEYTSVL